MYAIVSWLPIIELFPLKSEVEVTVTGHAAVCCTNFALAGDSHLGSLKRNNSNVNGWRKTG